MKYIKQFETREEEEKKKRKENLQIFKDLFQENPLSQTHDFYMFIGRSKFIELPDGNYKKSLEIENMVRIKPDQQSLSASNGLSLRVMVQHDDSALYHIWLPKEIRKDVEGKGDHSIEPWLVDLINTHKQKGSDDHGRQVAKDIKQRRNDMDKYNL